MSNFKNLFAGISLCLCSSVASFASDVVVDTVADVASDSATKLLTVFLEEVGNSKILSLVDGITGQKINVQLGKLLVSNEASALATILLNFLVATLTGLSESPTSLAASAFTEVLAQGAALVTKAQ
jgi:hypothetical protein